MSVHKMRFMACTAPDATKTETFESVQIFWAEPKIELHLVPLQKHLCRHKNLCNLILCKSSFGLAQKV